MESLYTLAVVQTGPVFIRIFALFGFIMLMIMVWNLLFKGNIALLFIYPAQLMVPLAAAAYYVSFFYVTYARGYYDVIYSGGIFWLSYFAAILLQKSYARLASDPPQPRPYDLGLIIVCALLSIAFAIFLLWAVMGYNFFYAIYDFFLSIFRWLGLVPREVQQVYPGRGRGGINLMLLLLSFRKIQYSLTIKRSRQNARS